MPLREKGAKDWTTFARKKGLVEKSQASPNARLMAALQRKK
jgi:hypothetical protein